MGRKAFLYIWIALCLVGVLAALIPAELLPDSFTPFVSARGTFDGKPVQLSLPNGRKSAVKVQIVLNMKQGVCKVSLIGPEGEQWLATMGKGRSTTTSSLGDSQLLLDPGQDSGSYRVFIGSKWHPLAPYGKIIVLFTCLGALAPVLLPRQAVSMFRGLGRKRFLFLSVVLVTAFFLYSVVHEFGHFSVATLLGGTVDHVAWTILSGEEPHVSYRSLPETARPWASAGGLLVPTALALILLSLWMAFSERMSWYLSVSLAVFGLVFLVGNVGCLFDVIEFDSLQYHHMGALAWHFGLRGYSMVLFVLSPTLLTIIVYVLFGYRLYKFRQIPSHCVEPS